jgi:hypothetical protein
MTFFDSQIFLDGKVVFKSFLKKINGISTCLLVLICFHSHGQLMPLEIIHYSGSPNQATNIVIMGDGYTASQQDKFISDAKNAISGMLLQFPWSKFRDRINVFAIKVVSNESGAAMDPNNLIDNYFGSSFWSYEIERALVVWRPN